MGERTGEGWETQKLSQTRAPPTLPAPTPRQPNHLLQPRGYGRGPGKTIKTISRRNVHLQLDSWREPRTRPLLSEAAGGLQEPSQIPVGTRVCRKAPLGRLTCLSCKVLSLSQDFQKPAGSHQMGVTKKVELSPGTLTPVLIMTGEALSLPLCPQTQLKTLLIGWFPPL